MKKNFKGIMVAFTLMAALLVAGTASAAWTEYGTVTGIYAGYSGGQIYVLGLENEAGCDSSLIMFSASDGDPEKLQTLVTSAYLAGKRIRCAVSGCSGPYQRGYQCLMVD